ncbi:MAG: methyltransferase domain-containing protein [Patescibacteria group bacterium]
MQDELKEIAGKTLSKITNNNTKIIAIDIGANDGTLLKYYPKKIYRIGVEPIKKLAKEARKHSDLIVNNFFTYEAVSKIKKNVKADIITAISCFYDMENPNKFVSDVKKLLKEDGIFVIQQNYLVGMLEQNAFDNIVHEHLEYYSLLSLNNLLARHGLEVFDVELRNLNGGSFRTYIALKGKRKITKKVKEMETRERKIKLNNKKIYLDFTKRIKKNRLVLKNFIKNEVKKEKKYTHMVLLQEEILCSSTSD